MGALIALLGILAGCGQQATTPPSPTPGITPPPSSGGAKGEVTALTNAKTTAKYFDNTITIEVKNVTLGFYPSKGEILGSDPKEEGKQFVRVEMTITNKSDKPFSVNETAYLLKTSADPDGDTYTLSIDRENADDFMVAEGSVTKDLKKDESVTGALYFEAPATDKLENLALVYEGYEGLDAKKYEIPFKK